MTGWIVAAVLIPTALIFGLILGRRSVGTTGGVDPATARSPLPDEGDKPTSAGALGPDAGAQANEADSDLAQEAGRGDLALSLISEMSPPVLIVDSADRLLLSNRAARELQLVQGDRIVVRRLLMLAREVHEEGAASCDLVLKPRSGGDRVSALAEGTRLGDGTIGIVLIDVTESRRVEAVRRDFVANVSHELKTPVGAITLLGEAIEDAADDQAAVRRFALSMQKESKRLSQLVQELIELSRLQGGEPSPPGTVVRIADIVAECTDRARVVASAKDIKIQVAGEHDLTVVGVERHLVMALTNLLTNAISYSPESTTVAVTYRTDGANAEILVKDQGIGIAPRDQKRVFERFYRVDRARSRQTGGTGLGLAIVKHIASNHGGSVAVWSREGAGSTFTLRIPRTPRTLPNELGPEDHSIVSDTALAEADDAAMDEAPLLTLAEAPASPANRGE